MRKAALISFILFFTACSSSPERPPSPDLNDHLQNSQWTLQSMDLKLKNLKGTCDFSKVHPNSMQEALYDNKDGLAFVVHRLHDSEPDGCHFQLLGADGHFTPASGLGGVFQVQILGTSTIQFLYQVGHLASLKHPGDREKYSSEGFKPAYHSSRTPAGDSPFVVRRVDLGDSFPFQAHCTRFETNGQISLRKKVVTCFLPGNQGWLRLEEK